MKHLSTFALLAFALAAGATALWATPDPPAAREGDDGPPPAVGSVLAGGAVPFDAQGFLARAGDALSAARWDEAAELLGDLVRADPRDHEAWMLLGFALHEAGRPLDALQALDMAARDGAVKPSALVQRAATLASLGRATDALDALRAARDAGFSNRALIDGDADLDPLRDDPRFMALRSELPARPRR